MEGEEREEDWEGAAVRKRTTGRPATSLHFAPPTGRSAREQIRYHPPASVAELLLLLLLELASAQTGVAIAAGGDGAWTEDIL
jgi:hypothetical protein